MNPRETNILVVGGAGMLGRPVAERLRLDGFTVTVMSTRPESASKTLGRDFRVVYGDVTLPETLRAPLEGQQCVFINLNSNLDERRYLEVEVAGTANVARLARETGAQRIGMISGASSHGEEIGVIYVDAKVRAERSVADSGIPYMIMRPSWFFESLPMFIRSGRARFLGKQPIKRRWLSAADYGRQVSRAFQRDDTVNKHYYNYGPEPLAIPEALARYCKIKHPGITPSSTPYTMAKVLSYAPGFNSLRLAIPFFKFFESSPEDGDAGETNSLLGANTQTLEEWAKAQP